MHHYDMLFLALSDVNLSNLRIFNNSCGNLCKDISLGYFISKFNLVISC